MKSKKITQSAKGEDCTLRVSSMCQDGETVVACHLNSPFKGVGFKSPDVRLDEAKSIARKYLERT